MATVLIFGNQESKDDWDVECGVTIDRDRKSYNQMQLMWFKESVQLRCWRASRHVTQSGLRRKVTGKGSGRREAVITMEENVE